MVVFQLTIEGRCRVIVGDSESVIEIISFMGLASYYRTCIEGFSRALPLNQLTRKDQTYVWDMKYEESFRELKNKLTMAL